MALLIDLDSIPSKIDIGFNKVHDYIVKKGELFYPIVNSDRNHYILYPTKERRLTKKLVIHLCKINIRPFYSDYHDSLEIYDMEILYPDKITLSTVNLNYPAAVYLLSFDHRDSQDLIPLNLKNSAVINFEQLFLYNQYVVLRKLYDKGVQILDYSIIHNMFCPKEIHLPYQYSNKEITTLKELLKQKKEFDIAMVANGTPHRINIQKILESKGVSINHVTGWTYARDKEIAKCRLLLNVHVDDEDSGYVIFEELRCVRWMFAGLPIISESSRGDDEQEKMHLFGIEFHPYEILVQKVIEKIAQLKRIENNDDDNSQLEREEKLAKCAQERKDKLEIVLKKYEII